MVLCDVLNGHVFTGATFVCIKDKKSMHLVCISFF